MKRMMTEPIAALLMLFGLSSFGGTGGVAGEVKTSIPHPPVIVLIVCKTKPGGPPDQNEDYTHWKNLEWATEGSMMVCRRQEVQLYDPIEGMKIGARDDPSPPLNPNFADAAQCARIGMKLSMDWDEGHKNSPWRVWRVGCPTPIIDTETGRIVDYKLPDCGHRDVVICEVDSTI